MEGLVPPRTTPHRSCPNSLPRFCQPRMATMTVEEADSAQRCVSRLKHLQVRERSPLLPLHTPHLRQTPNNDRDARLKGGTRPPSVLLAWGLPTPGLIVDMHVPRTLLHHSRSSAPLHLRPQSLGTTHPASTKALAPIGSETTTTGGDPSPSPAGTSTSASASASALASSTPPRASIVTWNRTGRRLDLLLVDHMLRCGQRQVWTFCRGWESESWTQQGCVWT